MLLKRVFLRKANPSSLRFLSKKVHRNSGTKTVYIGLHSLSYCCDLFLERLWHTWTPHKQKSSAMHNNRSLKLPILAFFMSKYRLCQHAGAWNTATLVTGYLHYLNSGDSTSAHPPLCYLTHFCWLNIHQWHFQWTHPHNKLLVYCC